MRPRITSYNVCYTKLLRLLHLVSHAIAQQLLVEALLAEDGNERTREAIDASGWMHTGDLATIDADGWCNIA